MILRMSSHAREGSQDERPEERSSRPSRLSRFIHYGEWPKPGTLPVCVRLPQIAVVRTPERTQGDENVQ